MTSQTAFICCVGRLVRLHVDQVGVDSLLQLQQFLVAARFQRLALVKTDYLVGVLDCGQAVSDHHCCSACVRTQPLHFPAINYAMRQKAGFVIILVA